MFEKLKEITQGWINTIWENPEIEKEAYKKAQICSNCPLNKNNICDSDTEGEVVIDFVYGEEERKKGEKKKGCGCFLVAKTRSPKSQCPLGKFEKDAIDT